MSTEPLYNREEPPSDGQKCSNIKPVDSYLSQKSLTALQRVTRDIAGDVANNIQKWNEKTVKGAEILKEIAKTRSGSTVMFPNGLEPLLGELYDTVQTISIYPRALIFLSSQMKSVAKLNHQVAPLFNTLTIQQLIKLVEDIAEAYRAEMKVKEYVLENVAYSRDKHEVLFHAACWVHQRFITPEVNQNVEDLLKETGHK